jgi:inorganic pyrophosphatase
MNLVDRIPIGDEHPCTINCIIEIPKGTSTKYEYDEQLDIFKLNRCLYSSMNYTASYGFIPQTLALDNDPLDVVVYNNTPINTGVLVEVKPIAALDMNDNGHKDYKVVCVPTSHIREYRTLKDLESHWVSKTLNFFAHYKDLEDKKVTINGWLSKTATKKIIKESHLAWCSNNGK